MSSEMLELTPDTAIGANVGTRFIAQDTRQILEVQLANPKEPCGGCHFDRGVWGCPHGYDCYPDEKQMLIYALVELP